MSAVTKIEWCDRAWNCVRGCALVSEGCRSCFAMKQAHRFSGPGKPYEGLTELGPKGPRWTGKIRTVDEALTEPLHWRKPQRIFVNSMSDLFHEGVPDDFVAKVFAVMAVAGASDPGEPARPFAQRWTGKTFVGGYGPHIFQVLTKRPARALALLTSERFRGIVGRHAYDFARDRTDAGYLQHQIDVREEWGRCYEPGRMWPLSNVWLGVSCENQQTADQRIPLLLQTPATVRFVSAEPLLGAIDISQFLTAGDSDSPNRALNTHGQTGTCLEHGSQLSSGEGQAGISPQASGQSDQEAERPAVRKLDWIIGGGESQAGARPMHPDWIRQLRDQCVAAGVPFLFKQWGEWTPGVNVDRRTGWVQTAERVDDRWLFGSEDLASEDGHVDDEPDLYRVGKKEAGRLLDGVVWDQFPETRREAATA